MSGDLPLSVRLAWWGTAWLRGEVVTDLMLDAVLGTDATHAVAGLHGLGLREDDATDTLLGGMARLRAEGARWCGAAFPVEGDPAGLGGPVAFNSAALEAGEAVVVGGAGIGLVPVRTGAAVAWTAYRAAPRQVPDIGEADRTLRRTLLEAAQALATLDVARWRPEVADQLMNLRHLEVPAAPAGVPPRSAELAARGMQATAIVELALEDDGGALTVAESTARREALLPLDRAGRHALVAACSPEGWPPT